MACHISHINLQKYVIYGLMLANGIVSLFVEYPLFFHFEVKFFWCWLTSFFSGEISVKTTLLFFVLNYVFIKELDDESPFALAKQLSVVSMTEKLVKYKLIEVAQAFCYSSI